MKSRSKLAFHPVEVKPKSVATTIIVITDCEDEFPNNAITEIMDTVNGYAYGIVAKTEHLTDSFDAACSIARTHEEGYLK